MLGEFDGVFDRAVAPAHLGGVLRGGVLRIVDKKICAMDKLGNSGMSEDSSTTDIPQEDTDVAE
jgi:hypothetical protein